MNTNTTRIKLTVDDIDLIVDIVRIRWDQSEKSVELEFATSMIIRSLKVGPVNDRLEPKLSDSGWTFICDALQRQFKFERDEIKVEIKELHKKISRHFPKMTALEMGAA